MALRANAMAGEKDVDLSRVNGNDDVDGGIAYGRELSDFVDAFMARDSDQLAKARQRLADSMGPEGMIEAAAVAGNFQRMVRIADSIGIPVDEPRAEAAAGLGQQLGLSSFQSAQNTLNRG